MKKRVIIIDTSNEIAGDGDLPHPSIGKARRMQVSNQQNQHEQTRTKNGKQSRPQNEKSTGEKHDQFLRQQKRLGSLAKCFDRLHDLNVSFPLHYSFDPSIWTSKQTRRLSFSRVQRDINLSRIHSSVGCRSKDCFSNL